MKDACAALSLVASPLAKSNTMELMAPSNASSSNSFLLEANSSTVFLHARKALRALGELVMKRET